MFTVLAYWRLFWINLFLLVSYLSIKFLFKSQIKNDCQDHEVIKLQKLYTSLLSNVVIYMPLAVFYKVVLLEIQYHAINFSSLFCGQVTQSSEQHAFNETQTHDSLNASFHCKNIGDVNSLSSLFTVQFDILNLNITLLELILYLNYCLCLASVLACFCKYYRQFFINLNSNWIDLLKILPSITHIFSLLILRYFTDFILFVGLILKFSEFIYLAIVHLLILQVLNYWINRSVNQKFRLFQKPQKLGNLAFKILYTLSLSYVLLPLIPNSINHKHRFYHTLSFLLYGFANFYLFYVSNHLSVNYCNYQMNYPPHTLENEKSVVEKCSSEFTRCLIFMIFSFLVALISLWIDFRLHKNSPQNSRRESQDRRNEVELENFQQQV